MSSNEYNNLKDLFNNLSLNRVKTFESLKKYNGEDWKLYLEESKKNTSDYIVNGNFHKILLNKNKDIEMYIIFWYKNAITTIHDHPFEGCVSKVVEGSLYEDLFLNIGNNNAAFLSEKVIEKDDISNKNGNAILHRIRNKSDFSASLQVYMRVNFKSQTYNIKN
jgi:hypothetical protein